MAGVGVAAAGEHNVTVVEDDRAWPRIRREGKVWRVNSRGHLPLVAIKNLGGHFVGILRCLPDDKPAPARKVVTFGEPGLRVMSPDQRWHRLPCATGRKAVTGLLVRLVEKAAACNLLPVLQVFENNWTFVAREDAWQLTYG